MNSPDQIVLTRNVGACSRTCRLEYLHLFGPVSPLNTVVSDRTRFSIPIMFFAARSARLTASPARTYSSSTRADCKILVVGAGKPLDIVS